MSRVSEGAFKFYREKRFGIRSCCDDLTKDELIELNEDIQLVKFLTKCKSGKDVEKIIENLT